eukprot:TRINITY_DN9333_c0_g1_i7.p1 TRINITY_DN9333_c0_g1~~TRINITY_DN9333_c0_g1_i7.p1  ORF type:complete len:119 (-),score=8.12 TRINITY_DN9333_c0_g1_i7:153-509(-)
MKSISSTMANMAVKPVKSSKNCGSLKAPRSRSSRLLRYMSRTCRKHKISPLSDQLSRHCAMSLTHLHTATDPCSAALVTHLAGASRTLAIGLAPADSDVKPCEAAPQLLRYASQQVGV